VLIYEELAAVSKQTFVVLALKTLHSLCSLCTMRRVEEEFLPQLKSSKV